MSLDLSICFRLEGVCYVNGDQVFYEVLNLEWELLYTFLVRRWLSWNYKNKSQRLHLKAVKTLKTFGILLLRLFRGAISKIEVERCFVFTV